MKSAAYFTAKIKKYYQMGLLIKKSIVITLLFMKALRHWTTLCWFFLSICSCLETEENNEEQLFSTSRRTQTVCRMFEIWCTFSYTDEGKCVTTTQKKMQASADDRKQCEH